MPTLKLHRRTLLKGVAAGTAFSVGLPVLEAMLDTHGEAYADGSPIEPFFIGYNWGSGVGNFSGDGGPDYWTPTGVGDGDAWALSDELAPLAEHKAYLTAFSNMRLFGPGSHHEMRAGVFCGQHYQNDAYNANGAYQGLGADRASIDQFIADRLEAMGQGSPFHSLVLALSDVGRHYNSLGRGHSFSWKEGFVLETPETSPHALYERLFAGFSPEPGDGPTPESLVELKALDAIKASADRLRSRVSSYDQQRIDQHLEGLFETERVLEELGTLTCEVPKSPAGNYDPDAASVEPLVEKNFVFSKLISQAVACGMTRSINYMFCGMQADPVIGDVGATDGLHLLTHNDQTGTQASQPEMVHAVATFIIERLADLVSELRSVQVGDGNLMDHGCIMVASEMMDGRRHSNNDGTPILLLGKAGGRLKTDVHHRPTEEANRNTSKVLVTVMEAMGLDQTSIEGGLMQSPNGPIDEILLPA